MSKIHELAFNAEEIDELLDSVDKKTIYQDATQSEHGLMSTTDKTKLDALPTEQQIDSALNEKVDKEDGKGLSKNDYTDAEKESVASAYHKPQNGIPESDLDSSVQTSLNKADTALQSFTETDPTVPSWAKQSAKPSYDYSEIGNTPDLSGFITKSVNDLTNYYLKSETYTKAEVAALIGAIQQFHYEIYATLPSSGESNVLYLIGPIGSGSDKYEEYVYANNAFTKIGDTSIDLSGYVTTSALNTALADYTTTANLTMLLSNKADKASNATNGNFAGLDANGNITDSGKKASDFATASQGAKADTAYQKPSNGIPESDLSSDVQSQLNKHFKGWFDDTTVLNAKYPSPVVGDYAYVKGAESTDPAAIYECTTNGSWSDSGRTADTSNVQTFASGEEVNEVHIVNDLTTGGTEDVLSAEQGKVLNNTKQNAIGYTYGYTPITSTELISGYISSTGISTVSDLRVRMFPITQGETYKIKGGFGSGNGSYLYAFYNGDTFIQAFDSAVGQTGTTKEYEITIPTEGTITQIAIQGGIGDQASCSLKEVSETINIGEQVLTNKNDIVSIEADLEQLQSDFDESIYTEVTIPQTWIRGTFLESPAVGQEPVLSSYASYGYCSINNLKSGDIVNAYCRAGSTASRKMGAKVKNGIIVATFDLSGTTLERTWTVDDTFDTIILNNYYDTGYTTNPTAEVITNTSRIPFIEDEIEDLQETVNDIIEHGVGGEINILCFGNSFTQDTMYYVPWLIKEAEPKLKLNLYFTYMGGMPISQCLAYISNGTVIAVDENGTPTTKYENHGGWDRIYSYSNGDWIEPDSSETNYHKSYTLYKYEDGANSWVSQSEPTAASVLQMKSWDLITIQQGSGVNYRQWDYYYKPYVYQIQAELQKQLVNYSGNNTFKLGYIMTHAIGTTMAQLLQRYNGYVEGGTTISYNIVDNATKMMENTPVEVLLPYATAVQNARTTYLDRFGTAGHLSNDNTHLANGIGDLIGAYANTMTILGLIGSKKSVVGSKIVPNAEWAANKGISQTRNIVGLSRYNIWLAQQCAVMATKYPLQLTDMVAKGMCGDTEIEIVNDAVGSSNPILSANNGDSWKTALIAPDGMTISNVNVVMGSIDITSSVYNSNTKEINIPNVSGKVTITATLTQ